MNAGKGKLNAGDPRHVSRDRANTLPSNRLMAARIYCQPGPVPGTPHQPPLESRGHTTLKTGENIICRNCRFINWKPNMDQLWILDEWMGLLAWPFDLEDRVIVQLANSVAGQVARNCILQDCLFDTPGTAPDSTQTFLVRFAGASPSAPHDFCAARGNLFKADYVTDDFVGIDPGLGRGFIAEENQLFNIKTGFQLSNQPAWDVVLWNNELHITRNGFLFVNNGTGTSAVGRIVLIENAINLASDTSGLTATAISLSGTGSSQYFTQLVCRKNIIAKDPEAVGGTNTLKGITVNNMTNAIVENNVINDCDTVSPINALNFNFCTSFKPFNNQTTAGVLLHAYDAANSKYKMELQDSLEDALLGF